MPVESAATRTKVLLVDDDPGICRALARGIGRAGYEVLVSQDIRAAIELGLVERPAVAVVDLHMPSGSGLTVIQEVREQNEQIHAIVLSGDPSLETRVKCFDAGANDFVAKPAYVRELVSRIAAAEREQRDRRELTEAKARAEQLYIYGREMASFLAHDLNNGFSIALANLSYLKDLPEIDEDSRSALEASLFVLNRMSVLTDNFLDIERLEAREIVPKRTMISLHKLLDDVVRLNHTRKSDGVRVEIECDRLDQVYVDGPLVERLLHNIVGNAMRYTNVGGKIEIHACRVGKNRNRLELTIANTGPRIPEANCRRLFEKFARPRDSKSRHGLGLYFCRLVCEAHGGQISVESDEDGTTFTMELSLV